MNIPVEQEDIIVEIPLDKLQGSILDIGPTATRKHLRMIDCNAFLDSQVLRIRQFQEHAPTSYSTVSYIWKGNGLGSTPDLQPRLFSVNGAEDGDPISINVLRDACLVSVHFDVPYLWLDQLCIMQTDKVDKNWQIVQMSQLYRGTTVCIVLPGGLQRLVPLDEETAWMHRAWTLQEAFLPKKTFVVFPWQKGEGKIYTRMTIADSGDEATPLQVIVPGQIAVASLVCIADACFFGRLRFIGVDEFQETRTYKTWYGAKGDVESDISADILGNRSPGLATLISALSNVNDGSSERAIWQCALGRTSSRPVDMVFSIMGLFGVTLDPAAFHRDDRIGVTIALIREILRKGGDASWVGAAPRMRPCPQLSHFPEFPKTNVAGKAEIISLSGVLVDAATLVDADEPDGPRIRGTIDGEGYLTLNHQACAATPLVQPQQTEPLKDSLRVEALDGSRWCLNNQLDLVGLHFPRFAAIFLGSFYKWGNLAGEGNTWDTKLMMVREHAPGKFDVMSFVVVDDETVEGNAIFTAATEWKEYTLTVGGPQPIVSSGAGADDVAAGTLTNDHIKNIVGGTSDDQVDAGAVAFTSENGDGCDSEEHCSDGLHCCCCC